MSVLEQEILFGSLVFTFVRIVAECTLPNAACLVDKQIRNCACNQASAPDGNLKLICDQNSELKVVDSFILHVSVILPSLCTDAAIS